MIYSNGPKTARFIERKKLRRPLRVRVACRQTDGLRVGPLPPSRRKASAHPVGIRMLIADPFGSTSPSPSCEEDEASRAQKDARISLSCFSHPLCLCMIPARPSAFRVPGQLRLALSRAHASQARRAIRRGALYSVFRPFVSSAPGCRFFGLVPSLPGHPLAGRLLPIRRSASRAAREKLPESPFICQRHFA